MTIKECYEAMGGDYDEIIHLLINEQRIMKYLIKFTEDKSMQNLSDALEQGDYEQAFRSVHTLKGVTINLGMKKLADSSHLLTEALRNNEKNIDDLYQNVKADYDQTIHAIHQLLHDA
ncbi:Hpt domain-containing protein [Candidatus Stoquefichus sp. SB1]|jgi:HPt (histidine-containing phosphotransfer) domain-containing protein|uniref:Hpt domain-containing protein n=1 Tax=Candidatus Stoquefichus sp. SB1 TaxID=1658109 RepID=UPI000AE137D4|nr:Hpt domain-containing protein [Candidatus Stoquefichus sp. SB1]